MAFYYFNPNPLGKKVGDCVIRAIAKAMDMTWDEVAIDLSMQMLTLKDMPNSADVWGEYLHLNGFTRGVLPSDCPNCVTVKQFCELFPKGTYIVGTSLHVIAVKNGDYYDTEDVGDAMLTYFWKKEI